MFNYEPVYITWNVVALEFYSLGQSKTEQEMILAQAQQHITMHVKPEFVWLLFLYFYLIHFHFWFIYCFVF